MACARPLRDGELIQIVDAAFAEAARKSGEWLVCRPGCAQCCVGAFAINALDATRLRSGIAQVRRTDPQRGQRITARAREYLNRVSGDFPGDARTGILDSSEEARLRFAEFANDEPCPALDPTTGTCDLYEFRPMTCRVFGPPIRNEDGSLGVCELCFHGATNEEIAGCEMQPDPANLEETLLAELQGNGPQGDTIVAFVLAEQS